MGQLFEEVSLQTSQVSLFPQAMAMIGKLTTGTRWEMIKSQLQGSSLHYGVIIEDVTTTFDGSGQAFVEKVHLVVVGSRHGDNWNGFGEVLLEKVEENLLWIGVWRENGEEGTSLFERFLRWPLVV